MVKNKRRKKNRKKNWVNFSARIRVSCANEICIIPEICSETSRGMEARDPLGTFCFKGGLRRKLISLQESSSSPSGATLRPETGPAQRGRMFMYFREEFGMGSGIFRGNIRESSEQIFPGGTTHAPKTERKVAVGFLFNNELRRFLALRV